MKEAVWFTNTTGLIGIVRKKDEYSGKYAYYIGTGAGHNEDSDIKLITEWGTRMPDSQGEVFFK